MKRAPHVDRCISKRGNSYHVHIVRRDENGKNKVYSRSFSLKDYGDDDHALKEAVIWRDEQEKLLDNRRFERYTVYDLFEKSMRLFTSSLKTKTRLNNLYNLFFSKYGHVKIDCLKIEDIQADLNKYASLMSQDQLARCVSMWRKIYRTANYSTYYCEDMSARLVVPKSKKPAKPKRQEVTEEAIEKVADKFLNYNESHANEETKYNRMCSYYIFQTARYTGMRPAEIMALESSDININNKTISINKAVGSTMSHETTIIPTKTETSTRVIYFNDIYSDLVKEVKKWTKHKERIFAKFNGDLWDIDKLSDTIYRVSKSAGENVVLYDLRHHYATELMKNGTPPAVVRDLMGHSNITMSIGYSRSTEEEKRKAIEQLNMQASQK